MAPYTLLLLAFLLPPSLSKTLPWPTDRPAEDTLDFFNEANSSPFRQDLCLTLLCGRGEVCGVEGRIARCVCAPPEACVRVEGEVCAQDNITYPSTCELERQSCLLETEIRIQHSGRCHQNSINPTFYPPKPFKEELNTIDSPLYDEDSEEWDDYYDSSLEEEKPLSEISPPKIVTLEESLRKHYKSSSTSAPDNAAYTVITQDYGARKCDGSDFVFLCNNLLLYFHAKYGEEAETGPDIKHGKYHLVRKLFSTFDNDKDGLISRGELERTEKRGPQYENLLPVGCSLSDLLSRGDLNADENLSGSEFLLIFGLEESVNKEEVHVRPHRVKQGEQYQILCSLMHQSKVHSRIEWQRYGRPLNFVPEFHFKISSDGSSLYLAPASFAHKGNYSCVLKEGSRTQRQIHSVVVYDHSHVEVQPSFLFLERGESGILTCGIRISPDQEPQIHWEKNLRSIGNNSTVLKLERVHDADTGSYSCVLSTREGTVRSSSSVIVRERFYQPEKSLREDQIKKQKFVALYEEGVKVLDTEFCQVYKAIPASFFSEKIRVPSLCPNSRCKWISAVVAGEQGLLYAAEETTGIAVIDIAQAAVVQIIGLEAKPKKLSYIQGTDSVWVELWNGTKESQLQIMLIPEASKPIHHSLTHALPNRNSFSIVSQIFLPPHEEWNNESEYFAYVLPSSQQSALDKVDVRKSSVVSRIDLSAHHCRPYNLAFLSQEGLVVVYCKDPELGTLQGQLLLDYVSDVVLSTVQGVSGTPAITENLQLISVEKRSGKIFVQKIKNRELVLSLTVEEYLPLDSWALLPSEEVYASNLYAVSSKSQTIISVSLSDGKVHHLPTSVGSNEGERKHLLSWKEGWSLVGSDAEGTVEVVSLLRPASVQCSVRATSTLSTLLWY